MKSTDHILGNFIFPLSGLSNSKSREPQSDACFSALITMSEFFFNE